MVRIVEAAPASPYGARVTSTEPLLERREV